VSEPLTTIAAVKGGRGLNTSSSDDDDALEDWIKTVSSMLRSAIGRPLHRVDDHTEHVGSNGTPALWVETHLPVVSISEITHDGDVVDTDDYELTDADLGRIGRTNDDLWRDTRYRGGIGHGRAHPRPPQRDYAVTYDGGWVTPYQVDQGDYPERTMPYDVEQAIIDYCVMQLRSQGRDPNLVSETIESTSYKYRGQPVPASFREVVDTYSIPHV
jgi:hypothetical protein